MARESAVPNIPTQGCGFRMCLSTKMKAHRIAKFEVNGWLSSDAAANKMEELLNRKFNVLSEHP